jgi:hypothetical protein
MIVDTAVRFVIGQVFNVWNESEHIRSGGILSPLYDERRMLELWKH